MIRSTAIASVLGLAAATAVAAQTSGELVTGLSYSTVYGGTGFADITVEDAFGTSLVMDFQARGGAEGHALRLGVGDSTDLTGAFPGENVQVFWRLGVSAEDWDAETFASRNANLTVGIEGDVTPTLSYRAETFWDGSETNDLDAAMSPLILRDEGQQTAYGVGLGLRYDGRDGSGLLAPGIEAGIGLRWAASPDDRNWAEASVAASGVAPLGTIGGVRISGSAGAIEGRADDGWVPIHDRVFLGGSAPRGFAYGGLGPRDAVTGDALGGTRFVRTSAEVLFPVRGKLVLGVFADAGSLWSLPGAGGGVEGDEFFMQTSYGISASWEFDFGTLSASLAEPVRHRNFDETQTLSLGLEASF